VVGVRYGFHLGLWRMTGVGDGLHNHVDTLCAYRHVLALKL
jgi:hypothetical protein